MYNALMRVSLDIIALVLVDDVSVSTNRMFAARGGSYVLHPWLVWCETNLKLKVRVNVKVPLTKLTAYVYMLLNMQG